MLRPSHQKWPDAARRIDDLHVLMYQILRTSVRAIDPPVFDCRVEVQCTEILVVLRVQVEEPWSEHRHAMDLDVAHLGVYAVTKYSPDRTAGPHESGKACVQRSPDRSTHQVTQMRRRRV